LEIKEKWIEFLSDVTLEIGKTFKIKTLKKMSQLIHEYEKYPDEDLPPNSYLDLIMTEEGFSLQLDGIVYIDQKDKIKLVEGIDFEFI
jgi:hypothetical protein